MSIGPSELGSTSAFMIDTANGECQVDFITANEMAMKDDEIEKLKNQLAESHKRGDELEQKLTQAQSKANLNE